jgi:DNA-binding MarR family transcriptional regulator
MSVSRAERAVSDHVYVPRDSVDELQDSWRRQRPDLDIEPVGVIGRLARVRGRIDDELLGVLQAHGLGPANFAVLVTLARIGGDEGVSQRRLMDELGLTSGTISVRMDRLVEEGFIDRRPDPASKRNTLISLTDTGRELFERVIPAYLTNQRRLLVALDDTERDLLATLLRKLLVEFEGSRPPAALSPTLGLTLAPAHTAIAMRESVGLPAVAALLVRTVQDQSPASQAGIRTGDLLVRAGGSPLRSIAALYAAIDNVVSASRRLRIHLLRGLEEHTVTIQLPPARRRRLPSASPGPQGNQEHII